MALGLGYPGEKRQKIGIADAYPMLMVWDSWDAHLKSHQISQKIEISATYEAGLSQLDMPNPPLETRRKFDVGIDWIPLLYYARHKMYDFRVVDTVWPPG